MEAGSLAARAHVSKIDRVVASVRSPVNLLYPPPPPGLPTNAPSHRCRLACPPRCPIRATASIKLPRVGACRPGCLLRPPIS
jgi:hypothetical protein